MDPINEIMSEHPGFSKVDNRCQVLSGRTYVVAQSDTKNLTFLRRFSEGLLLFFATFFTGGLLLIHENLRDSWKEVFSGKEIKHITKLTNDTQIKNDNKRDQILSNSQDPRKLPPHNNLKKKVKRKKKNIKLPVLNPNQPILQPPPAKQKAEINLARGLNFDPSAIDFSSPENASLAFALLNTDFLGLDLSDYPTISKNALALMISSLKAQRDKLPEEDQEKIEQLLQKFQCAYEVEILRDAVARNCNTTTEFNAAKHDLQQRLMERLEKGESLYLSSGWAGSPAGHNINLELIPFRNEEGALVVKGRIQNRGSGIDKHEAFIKGTKVAYDPELELGEIPLEKLTGSTFLSNYLQLGLMARPQDEGVVESEDTMRPTAFTKEDFYNVFLPSWPGRIGFSESPVPRIVQRGPTCTVKPLITEMTNMLGDESGKLAKFYITKASWEIFMDSVGVTEQNVDQIAPLLSKLSRRALKLKEAGLLPAEEMNSINSFCSAVKKEITATQSRKAKKLQSQATNIEARVQERANYSLRLPDIAPMPHVGETAGLTERPLLLNRVVGNNVDQFVAGQLKIAVEAKKTGSLKKAQSIVLHSLRALPNPSDDEAWLQVRDRTQLLKDIGDMQQLLLEATVSADDRLIITPQQACVWVKTLGITYRLAKETLPSNLCQFYANGLKNLIEGRPPALFCPFLPEDLAGYQDAINLIYEDTGDSSQNAVIGREVHTKDLNHATEYSEVPISSLAKALQNPELAYLYSIGKKHPKWKGRSGNRDFDELWCIQKAFSCDSYDGTNEIIPQEYQSIRQSYLLFSLALDFRGKKKHRQTPKMEFDASRSGDNSYFRTRFYALAQQDDSAYNRGVFADAFPGLAPQPEGQEQHEAETFATDLLGKAHTKNGISFTSHNALSSFQQAEVLNIGQPGPAPLSPLEIQDLLAVRTPGSLPLAQIEHYFTENLPKLEQPFFQSILMTLLFKTNEDTFESPLKVALDRSPPSKEIDNFFNFLSSSLKQARATRSWPIYFFLLRTYAVSLSHCLHHQGSSLRTKKLIKQFDKELDTISSKGVMKRLTGSAYSAFDNCLVAMVPYLSNYEAMKPVIHKFHDIRASLDVTEPDIAPIGDFHLQEDMQNGHFQIKNLPHLADTVKRKKPTQAMLPDSIAEHDLYTALFTINYPAQELSPGYYEFVDEKGTTYRIHSDPEGAVRIFRPFIGEDGEAVWHAFQKDDPFKNYGPSKEHPCSDQGGFLQTDAISWFKVGAGENVLITNRKSGDLICHVTPEQIYHPGSADLVLLKNYNQPVINELSQITSKKQILAWKNSDSGELSRIELKEFGMRFESEIDEDGHVKWKSSKHFGYYIDTHQTNISFEPFPHYLVLTNAEGHRKVICPSRRYAPDKIKFSGTQRPEMSSDTVKQLFSYDIDPQGLVKLPEDPKALLYLIHLSLEKQDYQLGFQAMKKMMQHPSDWDESMVKAMQYFELPNPNDSDKLNQHPQASALRLKLKATMLSQSSQEMDDTQKKFLKKDYINYLNQLNNVQGIQRLSLENERLLYDVLADVSLSTNEGLIIRNRMKYLEEELFTFPEEFRLKIAPSMPELPILPLSDQWGWIDDSMQKRMISALGNPTAIAFTMRPGVSFLQNFLFYYSILQQEGPQNKIDEIKELLKACRYASDPRIKCVRALLLGVVADPTAFPPCEKLLELSDKQKAESPESSTELEITLKALVQGKDPVAELSSFDSAIKDRRETGIRPAGRALEPTKPKKTPTVLAEFNEIPDTLLETLLERDVASQILPGDEDLSKLQERLDQLKGLGSFYESQAKSEDPSIAREFGRLQEGVMEVISETEKQIAAIESAIAIGDISQLKNKQLIVHISDDKIDASIEMLEKMEEEELALIEESEIEIGELLQTYSADRALEMHGALLRPLTLEEALIHFGRGDDEPFYRANPDLTQEALGAIKVKIGQYLVNKLNTQKRLRLLDDLNKVRRAGETNGTDSIDYFVAKTRAIQTLRANRVYTVDEAPHLLVFESFANICLREEQLSALDKLTSGDSNQDLIFEARTGFGKSKALIPLWLYLTGKKRKVEEVPGISMMTVPASLYQQQVSYLKKVLGGAFNQSVLAFQFNRAKCNDLRYLQNLNRKLDKAAAEGMCVLTTVNSLHSLVNLKLKECLSLEKTEENRALIRELRALRYKAKHQLSNFFDESRECFDIRRYFDYAVGAPKTVPRTYCQALGDLYDTLLSLDLAVPFDFLPGSEQQDKRPLTEERYNKEIKEVIGKTLLDRLLKNNVLPNPGEKYNKLLLSHFMGEYDPQIDQYLNSIPEPQRRLYAIYRDQLNVYLPRTLTRQCNGRYGLAPTQTGNRFAYPFERGVPKLSSQFSTIDDLIDFTIQGNLKTPFTFQDISKFITSLKFRMEQAENKQDFRDSDPEYQCYLKITRSLEDWPASISDCGQNEILRLQKTLNIPYNLQLKLAFITGHIIPKITIHTKKVSSTSHNLVEAMENTYGASGTVNADTLSPKLSTIEHLGTPIGSILSMWKDSQQAIFTVRTQEASEILKATISEHNDYRVIIDVDSTFRDLRDEKEIARIVFENTAILDNPPVDAFSYYDEAGQNMVFMRPNEGEELGEPILRDHCTTPLENIFVFMRQSSAVGADTPMPMTAKALVTVGSETQRDLFLQGVGRMRGILTGQKVGFIIQEKDVPSFQGESEELTLPSILSVVSKNQGEQRGQDLFFNLRLLLQNILEKQFWDHFDNKENSIDDCMDLFHAMEDFFVENSIQDPLDSLRQSRGIIPIEDAVQQIKDGFARKLAPILESEKAAEVINVESLMESFDKLVDFDKLPTTIKMGSAEECEGELEVEAAELESESAEVAEVEFDVGAVESESEKESDQESERERATVSALPSMPFTPATPLPSQNYETLGLDNSSTAAKSLGEKFSPLLEGFYGSTNFFRINAAGLRPKGILKTAYQYLIIREEGQFKVVLMDQQDAQAAMKKMIGDRQVVSGSDFYLMSSTGKVIAQNAREDFNEEQWRANPQLSLLTKIFSRQLNFSRGEVQYLASLSPNQRAAYFDFFNNEIAYCWPPVAPILTELQSRVEEILY